LAAHSILYLAIKTHFDTHRICPDNAALHIEVDKFCAMYGAGRPGLVEEVTSVFAAFKIFKEGVNELSEPIARDVISKIAKQCIHQPAVEELLSSALAQKTVQGLGQQILELEAKVAGIAGGVSKNNLGEHEPPSQGARVLTEIPWLDARFGDGNGFSLGSLLAILAGQGVGKTSLGIQLGVSQALAQRHSLLVLAEEGLSRAVRRRILAGALGVSTVELEKYEKAKTPISVAIREMPNRAALESRLSALNKYLHVLDIVNNPGDLSSISSEIEAMRLSGKQLTYVYVDWAGPLAEVMLSKGFRGMVFSKKHDALKALAAELALTAARTNTIIAISHQMAGAQFKRGPMFENDQYCAADCSTFTEMCKYVLVINPRDPKSGCNWLKVAKARDDAAGAKLIVKLTGELSQFSDVSDKYTQLGNSFRPKMAGSRTGVPKEGGGYAK
jgi:hypothetical protein